ncbi:C-C motif chemokine 25 [Erinaceus europaeus]|uniref:C-C motif chemokine 25 n=1 Tax=Erinaceus europaeus TaxID=9365 RepID=A0A1S3WNH0_ERIEU|nr:C-C motif chemokine 25 [Erinaceus europaeus]
MKPCLLCCLGFCILGAWAPTVGAQGAFEDCCLAHHHPIPKSAIRQRATKFHYQSVSGSCNLKAVIFFLPRRVICGDPRDPQVQGLVKLLKQKLSKKMPPGGSRRARPVSHLGAVRLHSGGLPQFRDLTRSSTPRNASHPAMPSSEK